MNKSSGKSPSRIFSLKLSYSDSDTGQRQKSSIGVGGGSTQHSEFCLSVARAAFGCAFDHNTSTLCSDSSRSPFTQNLDMLL